MTDKQNELAIQEENLPAEVANQRMIMLREALTNPDVDPAKAIAMADLIFNLEDRDLRAQFNRDKVRAINQMPSIMQAGQNSNTKAKYAKFEDLHRRVRPILDAHNLTIRFDIGNENGQVAVTPILEHQNGQSERGLAMLFPSDTGPGRSPVQAVASAASYGKRHSMKAMLNIIEGGEDDDGEGGGTPEDRLTKEQRDIVDAGRSAAMGGSTTYMEWFKDLNPAVKGWLAFEPYHGQNKEAAELIDNPQ